MAVFRQALQAVKDRGTLKAWEVKALQAAADAHLEHIHAHHHNEDNLLGPEFEKRFKFINNKVSEYVHEDETSASIYYRTRLAVLTFDPATNSCNMCVSLGGRRAQDSTRQVG
jgi:hypothetical protein